MIGRSSFVREGFIADLLNRDDWDLEAGQMFFIYSNASLTVAATSSPGASHGFLGPKTHHIGNRLLVEHEDTSIETTVRELTRHDDWGNVDWNPLYTRAWAFQETLMSPRLISFGAAEIEWYCYASEGCCECTKEPQSWWHPHYELLRRQRAIVNYLNFPLHYSYSERITARDDYYDAWEQLVDEYTTRYLTVDSDRLPALSGLATKFQQALIVPESDYLARLWRAKLLNGLAWQCSEDGNGIGTLPQKYRAPSWSWASIEAPIIYGNLRLLKRPIDTVIESAFTVTRGNVFGEVTDGCLVISGKAAYAKLELPSYNPADKRTYDPTDIQVTWVGTKKAFRGRLGVCSFRADVPLVEVVKNEWPLTSEASMRRSSLTSADARGKCSAEVLCLLIANLNPSRHFLPESLFLMVLGPSERVVNQRGFVAPVVYERLGLLTVRVPMITYFYDKAKSLQLCIV